MTVNQILRALAVPILWWSGCGAPAAADPPVPRAAIASPEEPVFLWRRDRCADDDIPDAPLRVLRRDDGTLVGFASHYVSRLFLISPDRHFSRDCRPVFSSRADPDPATFDDRIWIASTWSDDGRHVAALGHDEYQGQTHPGHCTYATYRQCWYNSVVLLRSDDGGRSFAKLAAPPIAVARARFQSGEGMPRGFFDPTNLVAKDGWHYAIIYNNGEPGQPRGNCLFRAGTVTEARSWEYWTGNGFEKSSFDPYGGALPPPLPCQPLAGLNGRVFAIVLHKQTGWYVGAMAVQGETQQVGEIGLVFSRDLINWSGYEKLLDASMIWSKSCAPPVHYGYPSLVDLASTDRNFSEIGDHPALYLTRLPLQGCSTTLDRDLVRYQLSITAQ